ncbi:hypothetical protein DL98DRAFT_604075 [Cadophora sp. DSE1049]|nr:hypothetical protein DL98DRAFT_604075 [Cadophora sp. DSE1049]
MSQQQHAPSDHTERPSNTQSKLIPRPMASGDFNQATNRQPPPKTQPSPTIGESSNPAESQRHPQQEKSGFRAGTANGNSARPAITLTEASTSTMNTERGERGTERGRQIGPSAQQPNPSNRLGAAAGTVDHRPSARQEQASSRYEQSRCPPESNSARPSMHHVATSESMRKKETSYYAEEAQPESRRDEGSYYGQTAAQQSKCLAQTEQSLARSRRYSPRRASPPPLPTIKPPSRSISRSPPLSERLTVFHKPISVLPGQPSGPSTSSTETLSTRDADSICDDLVRKVKNAQLGKMYDRVVEVDRRGLVDDGLYDMVLDFVYRFLPMVFANGESDPIIINRRQILDHQRVWQIFGPRGEGLSRKDRGKHRPHPWYTRPKDKKMSFKDVVGEVVDSIPRVQIVPGPGKRKKDEGQEQR